jgi:hypothetical protein
MNPGDAVRLVVFGRELLGEVVHVRADGSAVAVVAVNGRYVRRELSR